MNKIIITESDFDVAQEYQAVCDSAPRAGAVVFFVGLVRDLYEDSDETESIEYLELEHYAGMTESLCAEIVEEAQDRYPFDHARVIHRVGKIYPAEQIVMVVVASRHRDNAFQAAQFIMDYLKTRATLWKKEVGSKGQQWLGVKTKDAEAASRWSSASQTET